MAANPIGTASVSWVDSSGNLSIHVYWTDGYTVSERMFSNNAWTTGGFSQPGEQVSATVWQDSGGVHIRVYCTFEDALTEWCQDAGKPWYNGGFSTG